MISNCPSFLLQLNFLECFMFHVSSLFLFFLSFSLNPHPSNRVSCSHFRSLGSSPFLFFERARLRVSGRLRARLFLFFRFVRFKIRLFFFRASWSSIQNKELAKRIDPSPLPRKCTEKMLCILPQDHGVLVCCVLSKLTVIQLNLQCTFLVIVS